MRPLVKILLTLTIGVILVGAVLVPTIEETNVSGEDVLDVVILGGQSNIAYNPIRVDASVVNDQIALPSTNCYYFGTDQQAVQYPLISISDCSMQSMTEGNEWRIGGEEPAIAKKIADKTNDDVYIINVAIGGTAIANFLPGTTGGDWIEDVLTAALSIIPAKYSVHKCGWVWCQGESDKTTAVADYIESFGTLNDYFKSKGFDYCYLVETKPIDSGNATAAQRALPSIYDNVTMASTAPATFTVDNGLLRNGDPLHYSQAGRNIVGEQVGAAIANNLPAHSRDGLDSPLLQAIPIIVIVALLMAAVGAIALRRAD